MVRGGLRDAAIGVLDTRPVLHDADAEPSPIGHTREAICHVDERFLAAGNDRPDADRGGGIDQRVVRVREELFHPLLLQNPRDGVRTIHPLPSFIAPPAQCCG